MADPVVLARFNRTVRAVLLSTPNITTSELKNSYKERSGRDVPLEQLGGTLERILEDCDCIQQGGKWRLKDIGGRNAENLTRMFEKMDNKPKKGRGGRGGGSRPSVGPSRFPASYNSVPSNRVRTPAYASNVPYTHTRSNVNYQPSNLETNFTYRNGFANRRSDWPEDSNYDDMDRQDVRGSDNNRDADGYSNNDYASANDRPLKVIYNSFNPDSDSDDRASLSPPPGLSRNSGYRPDSTSGAPRDQSDSTSIDARQPIGASFYFPPPPVPRSVPQPSNVGKSDEVSYDELCPLTMTILLESWPAAFTAEELMNQLASEPSMEKWAEQLVGPQLMEHNGNVIAAIHKELRCIFIEDAGEDKIYSFIPGTPDASNEKDLYEQVGKMLCLILKQHGHMDIETAQSRLGLSDDGGPHTNLNGCALVLEAAKSISNSIIIGSATSGQGKDRRLSLRYGASVTDLRSQISIRSRQFKSIGDQGYDTASCSSVDRVADLLTQCDRYDSDKFAIFEQHPLIEDGPGEEDDTFQCTLVYYSNLDKFTVRLVDDSENYEKMQAFLQEDYGGIVWDERLCKYIKEGAAVGVKMEGGKFARGIVYYYDRNPNERSFVYLVDEGCLDEVPIANIFPLKDNLKVVAPLGIRCTVGSFKTNADRIDKYHEEHQEIWNTLNKQGFISITALNVVSCGSKKELLVSFTFETEQDVFTYPSDLVKNNIITVI